MIEQLKLSKHDIYVVVAWITDDHFWQILLEKVKNGIGVTIILKDDDINQNNGFDYNIFCQLGGTICWDDHHHKFCVIDRKTVIAGSYNWTYAANNRFGRENILIIKDEEELIEQFSIEFQTLKRQSRKHIIKPHEVIKLIEVEKIIEVEKVIEVEKIVKVEVEKRKRKFQTDNGGKTFETNTKILADFNGWLRCGKCKTRLNSHNQCLICSLNYQYDSTSKLYQAWLINKNK